MGPRRAVQTQTFFETAEKKVISMLQWRHSTKILSTYNRVVIVIFQLKNKKKKTTISPRTHRVETMQLITTTCNERNINTAFNCI